MTEIHPLSSDPAGIILLRSDRFFARRVPLAPGGTAARQVELALENFSPFPVDQLYHGYVLSPAGDAALVYAAHRKQFSAVETATWNAAGAVLPALVALLGDAPPAPAIRLWRNADVLTGAAWDGRGFLPAVLLARTVPDNFSTAEFVAGLRDRAGLADAPVTEFTGAAHATRTTDGRGFAFTTATPAGDRTGTLGRAEAAGADIREKGFLAERQRTGRRDLLLWRVFSAGVAALVGLLVVELGLFGTSLAVGRLRTGIQQRATGVEQIATAQSLSERIGEISKRRLMPFEMLAVLNRPRPASVLFLRATTTGQHALEVEAQTPNASEVGAYEAALRAAPELATVETRDLRSRDGVTTFTLTATFNADALSPEVRP